ncbi:helix-turn-helix domain-containing protein [Paraburkholderia xenovorans]|uniref:helix-turn-helix domain-containing protein n=1 Tax=Paraburkholderia xenovorans TaxID=36873 RepID=UPI0038B9D743
MLSIEEIADILKVSRPFAVTLADAGKLGVVETGDGQRRISAAAVGTYCNEQRAKARHALDELSAISQGAGLYSPDVKKGRK